MKCISNLSNWRKWIYLVLFLLFLLLANIFSLFLDNSIGKINSTKKVQKEVLQIEQECNSKVIQTTNELLSKGIVESQNAVFLNQNNQVDICIYLEDSICAWSTNNYFISISKIKELKQDIFCDETGFYFIISKKIGDYTIIGTKRLKTIFPFHNEFLTNSNSFRNAGLNEFDLSQNKGEYSIYNKDNNFLFSLVFTDKTTLSDVNSIILFILYLLAFIYFASFLFTLLIEVFSFKVLTWIIFVIILIVLRCILQNFGFPLLLYESKLFQPSLFASSFIFSSLGDSIFTTLLLLSIVIAYYILSINSTTRDNIFIIGVKYFALLSILFIMNKTLVDLVFNSNLSVDLVDYSDFGIYSILGYFLLSLNFISFIFSLLILKDSLSNGKSSFRQKAILILSFSIVYIIIFNDFFRQNLQALLGLIFIVVVLFVSNRYFKKQRMVFLFSIFLLFSMLFNISFYRSNEILEIKNRTALLLQIANNQDPELEFNFSEVEKKIYSDSSLTHMFLNDSIRYDKIGIYLNKTYFNNDLLSKKYDLQITICNQSQNLIVKPDNIEVLCNDFFYQNLLSFGKQTTASKNLYRLEFGSGQINYLGLIKFLTMKGSQNFTYTVYLEINSKLKRKGFTGLLNDEGKDPFEKLENYSLAKYYNDTLVESYGKHQFKSIWLLKNKKNDNFSNFVEGEFSNTAYFVDTNYMYVLSSRIPKIFDIIAPFSNIFFFLVIVLLLLSLLVFPKLIIFWDHKSFKYRLQLSIIGIIFLSFIVISILSIFKISKLNNDKNRQTLSDYSSILKNEFEGKIRDFKQYNIQYKDYMDGLVIKFSRVFDTDINIYSTDGVLISTSRDEMYETGIKSKMLLPLAYYNLKESQFSSFITKETAGKLSYYSAFLPIRNKDNLIIAYLNVPYFARQSELTSEISSFLTALFNVYSILIFIAVFISFFIARYVTLPLIMVGNTMKRVQIGSKNEKIVWKKDDEIGRLVLEYNRMIDELSKSAVLLAESERENAWSEMAKQVAHEIKNPLTPMKLSLQYLMKAWDDKVPDIDSRLKSLSQTMINQIDTLSEIANSFSDFAKMPQLVKQNLQIEVLLEDVIELFKETTQIKLEISNPNSDRLIVFADTKYLTRVFNNLITNAIQAIDGKADGFIKVSIKSLTDSILILIEDNGCGISEEGKKNIFVPNFTTKSGGMGLGLAMSKNIILEIGGKIDFESELGKGTIFTISLPKISIN